MVASIPRINLLLISSWMCFWPITDVLQYLCAFFFFTGATTECWPLPLPWFHYGKFFRGGVVAPHRTPNLGDQGLYFVRSLPFDLSGTGGTTRSLRSHQHSYPDHWICMLTLSNLKGSDSFYYDFVLHCSNDLRGSVITDKEAIFFGEIWGIHDGVNLDCNLHGWDIAYSCWQFSSAVVVAKVWEKSAATIFRADVRICEV
jgi:hypothetical protein